MVVRMRLEVGLTESETAYLALHVSRVAEKAGKLQSRES